MLLNKRKPRVAFVAPTFSMGGVERWMVSLAKHFIEVEPIALVNLHGKADKEIEQEMSRYCLVHNEKKMMQDEEVCKYLRRADAVMSWECPDLRKYKLKCPIIDTSHNEPIWNPQKKALELASLFATHYAAVSEATAVTWSENVRDSVKVIYNGIEIDRILPRYGRSYKREELGIQPHEIMILFLGRLHHQKRPDLLARSMNFLPSNYKVVFSGAGDLYNEISEMSYIDNRIQIVEPKTHVGDLFAAADVFVLPSKFEGMPLVLLEAMAAGVPVITTDYTVSKELTRKFGKMYWSLPIDIKESELASEIESVVAIGRNNLVTNYAQKICLEEFNVSRMTANWEKYIIDAINDYKR